MPSRSRPSRKDRKGTFALGASSATFGPPVGNVPPAVRMSSRTVVNGTHSSQPGNPQQHPSGAATSSTAAIPAYLSKWYEVIGKIGEGTYGVVYLARSRGARSRLLAVKTFKPGKVRLTHAHNPCLRQRSHGLVHACLSLRAGRQHGGCKHEEGGVRPCIPVLVCNMRGREFLHAVLSQHTGGGRRVADGGAGDHAAAGDAAREHRPPGQRPHQPRGTCSGTARLERAAVPACLPPARQACG